ncbi:tRNA pseudouridine(55) synthase TruB [Lentiprolixibacter aurantiacus]|uniref:tRNA pseudouridine synthase B n=1 Tax=Lentiprolixibacter aurantiacus TaxID=2993939 RepID=A0AAE3MIJ7_9FLAO|nr:tRNA pseudouridine(55) synthase TruB [Lentiprolixibacter aurantiacus]MCX2718233.1 tRNA pseudouridine(55) synthase TruB [Lentiprolixibacter aurantiacus]
MKTKDEFLEGQVLLIDKPLEWSSFQAVNAVRWAISKRFKIKKIKVGHAGTLDPLATGLLLICTGKYTKKIAELQGLNKEYTGTITLGARTPSYDLETEISEEFPTSHIDEQLLLETAKSFVGTILQAPPVFSAVKKKGKRLYEYARQGKEVEVTAREVTIHEFEITRIEMPEIRFRVVCGKGTYIRSLAHDFGKALKSGAYLSELRRTKIGDFNVNKGISPVEFRENLHIEEPRT